MKFDDSILKYEEKAIFALRQLYKTAGYRQFKMSKFEEYDLYSKNKDFLVSDGVITFNDTNGRLLALKPDVTLSIINNSKDIQNQIDRFYYNENVYRISESSHTYKEIMQTGIECIGDIDSNNEFEVSLLAAKSLSAVSDDFVLHISNMALLSALLDEYEVEEAKRSRLSKAIADKNADELKAVCAKAQYGVFITLINTYPDFDSSLEALSSISLTKKSKEALESLKSVCEKLKNNGYGKNIKIDFSILNAAGYYSGIVFKGYVNGIASQVLSGGRYDKLMKRMGRTSGAVGFAVYLDTLERFEEKPRKAAKQFINIALPKGRLGEKV